MNEMRSTVKNLMSTSPVLLNDGLTLDEAEAIFAENHLTAAPVLAADNKVCGVITDFHLVKFLLKRVQDQKRNLVRDYIDELDPVILIREDDPITNAFRLMIQSPNHRVFATTEEGIISGALSPKDLIPFLAGDSKKRLSAKAELTNAQNKIQKLVEELLATKHDLVEYQKFFDNSPFMMHSIDTDGNIVMANHMLHLVLEYPYPELIGKHVTTLYPYQNHKEAAEGLNRIMASGFHPLVSTLMVKKDSSLVKVDLASTVKSDENGLAIGTITIAKLSDSQNMLETLKKAAYLFNLDRSKKLKQSRENS